jgi:hypothetical protein
MEDELPNEGLTALYGKIEDVTTQILEGTALANEGDKRKNSRKHHLIERFPKESWQENKIRTFMKAINTSFVTETFLMCVWLVLHLHQ